MERNIKAGRLPGEFSLKPRYGSYVSRPFPWLYASKEHVEKILEGTGWRARRFIEDSTTAFVAIIDKHS